MKKKPSIIKICGITNLDDARLSLETGADWLGFNFYPPSPRYVEPEKAAQIIKALPPETVSVGVFVNAGSKNISATLAVCPLAIAQLHGDETNQDCLDVADLNVRVIKAFRIKKPQDIRRIADYDVETVLLDAFRPDLYGGTGDTFNWDWIRQIHSKKIILAGGITPDNIRRALQVGTYGIDLCSGVEKSPGLKDVQKMKKLFKITAKSVRK